MADESLRKARRKPKSSLHLLESPFPIPIENITGRKCDDKRWYYYFGILQSDHVSISRLGDLTFLYRLGFFGRGVFSRSQPQFEKYKDVLSDEGRKLYMRHFSVLEPEARLPQQNTYIDIVKERLRQHDAWLEIEEKNNAVTSTQVEVVDNSLNTMSTGTGDVEDGSLDGLLQCSDLHTEVDNLLVEEASSSSEDVDLYVIPKSEDNNKTELSMCNQNTDERTDIDHSSLKDSNVTDNNCKGESTIDNKNSEESVWKEEGIMDTQKIDTEKNNAVNDNTKGTENMNCDAVNDNTQGTENMNCDAVNDNTQGTENMNCDTVNDNTERTENMSCENISVKRPLSDDSECTEKRIKLEDSYKLYECLQLTLEEAFFLSYGLGCLSVKDESKHDMSLKEMWIDFTSRQKNFLQMYAAYHHFRSKGWVVHFSKTYGTDFVLYQDGIPFYHASYCVIVNFVHEDKFSHNDSQLSWKQLTALSRINERAGKSMLFCYVVQPKDMCESDFTSPSCIKKLKIMEVILQRWCPEKYRES